MPEHEVIIIGGGPTGLAAASALSRMGVPGVVVLEREPEVGGIARHCAHGGFGFDSHWRWWTGPQFAQRLRDECRQTGVTIRTGTSVTGVNGEGQVRICHNGGVETLAAKRVLLATGAREMPRSARLIGGSRPLGVMTTGTLQQHVVLHGYAPFSKPLIVGSEWVSFSAIMTCRHLGIAPLALVEEGPHSQAFKGSGWLSKAFLGTPLWCNTRVLSIEGHRQVDQVVLEHDGQRRTVVCDGVILTGRFLPDHALILDSPFIENWHAHQVLADPVAAKGRRGFETQTRSVFAAGNVLMPLKRSGQCYLQGLAAAKAIADSL